MNNDGLYRSGGFRSVENSRLWPIVVFIVVAVAVAGYVGWQQATTGVQEDTRCKQYGQDWHLWHSKTDPSFKGCKNSEGTLKDIPT